MREGILKTSELTQEKFVWGRFGQKRSSHEKYGRQASCTGRWSRRRDEKTTRPKTFGFEMKKGRREGRKDRLMGRGLGYLYSWPLRACDLDHRASVGGEVLFEVKLTVIANTW